MELQMRDWNAELVPESLVVAASEICYHSTRGSHAQYALLELSNYLYV